MMKLNTRLALKAGAAPLVLGVALLSTPALAQAEEGASDEVIGTPSRPVGSVNVRGGMPTLPNLLRGRFVVSGSADSEVRGTATLRPRWDRVSWREITAD